MEEEEKAGERGIGDGRVRGRGRERGRRKRRQIFLRPLTNLLPFLDPICFLASFFFATSPPLFFSGGVSSLPRLANFASLPPNGSQKSQQSFPSSFPTFPDSRWSLDQSQQVRRKKKNYIMIPLATWLCGALSLPAVLILDVNKCAIGYVFLFSMSRVKGVVVSCLSSCQHTWCPVLEAPAGDLCKL